MQLKLVFIFGVALVLAASVYCAPADDLESGGDKLRPEKTKDSSTARSASSPKVAKVDKYEGGKEKNESIVKNPIGSFLKLQALLEKLVKKLDHYFPKRQHKNNYKAGEHKDKQYSPKKESGKN